MPKEVSSSSDDSSDTEEVPQKRRKQASRRVAVVGMPGRSTACWVGPLVPRTSTSSPATRQRLDSVVCAPAFSGLLNICESYGDCSTNQTTIAIPATPAPTVPPGFCQRFQPFGSRTPTLSRLMTDTPDTPLPSSRETPFRVTLDPGEERKSKKKKKRKDKLLKTEEEEVVRVKQELLDMSPEESYERPGQEAELSEEKRRRRKKTKKDKDRGEAEGTVDSSFNVIKQEVEVKVEPMDSSYGDVEDSGKNKKIKKN